MIRLPFSTAKLGALVLAVMGALKIWNGVHAGDSQQIQQGAAEVAGALGINGIRAKQERTETAVVEAVEQVR